MTSLCSTFTVKELVIEIARKRMTTRYAAVDEAISEKRRKVGNGDLWSPASSLIQIDICINWLQHRQIWMFICCCTYKTNAMTEFDVGVRANMPYLRAKETRGFSKIT